MQFKKYIRLIKFGSLRDIFTQRKLGQERGCPGINALIRCAIAVNFTL